jgi:hypothetical protein
LDGSEKSYEALLKAFDFGDKPGDKIYACFAPKIDGGEIQIAIVENRLNEIIEEFSAVI